MTKVIIDDEYLFEQDLDKRIPELSRVPPYIRQAVQGLLNKKNRQQVRDNYRQQLDIIRRVLDLAIDAYDGRISPVVPAPDHKGRGRVPHRRDRAKV